ncbi:dienelactone hydrolase family protein [Falsiroseomonas sp.]|uniref:dienelactone hydrolase family protein n=1 Tax=Falsiroseomonas sp. TaxID=2870721 RepID=UPI003566F2D0
MDRQASDVTIPPLGLGGVFARPDPGANVVVFAHGQRQRAVQPPQPLRLEALRRAGLGTLLFDLLLPEEAEDRRKVFDIPLLAHRLAQATEWLHSAHGAGGAVPVGYFGASTGAGAALLAAAEHPAAVRAVVSRGGRPDLAGVEALGRVRAPTLLIVGSLDPEVLALNREAAAQLGAEAEVRVVQGASHLFEEAGTLEAVVVHARDWFVPRIGRERGQP